MPQAYFPLTLALAGNGDGHLTVKPIPTAAVLKTIRSHMHALDSGLALVEPQTLMR